MKQKIIKLMKGKTFLYIIMIIALSSFGTNATAQKDFAQERGHQRFKPEQFIKDLETFITKNAELTAEEAKLFFPKYHEFKKQQREAMGQINKNCRRVEKENLSEKECEKILLEIEKYQDLYAVAQAKAYKEWREVLSAKKIIKVIHADQQFGKRFYRNMAKPKK